MAHELTTRADGYTEMAFVGSTPWHGLGQELKQDASIEEWRKAAGMDWTIKSAPVQYVSGITQGENPSDDLVMHLEKFEGQNVLYRSDTKAALSVVSNRYKTVQPHHVLDFFKDLVEENGFRLHTAGTLFGGKRFWALAETGRFAEVTEGDGIGGFLLLSTSADKSLATTARFTSVRVVCNNTLSMAGANNANCVSFTHTREFDHELMKAKLGAAVGEFDSFMDMSKHLQKQRIQLDQAKEFVAKILDSQYTELNEPKENRTFRKIIELFSGDGKGAEMVGNTKWGLLNAVTEYYDHHLPARTDDARLNSAWFGTGDSVKAKALEVLSS